MKFKVAVVQFAPNKGQLAANLDRIAEAIDQACQQGAQLVTFPETAPTGYFLEGGVVELALSGSQLALELETRLAGKSIECHVSIGYYEAAHGNLYNSCAYIAISGGKAALISNYRKFFLPTYGVFDEERFVSRGNKLGLVETPFGKAGMLICEDVWHSVLPTLVAVSGALIALVPSASPARGFRGETVDNADRYERLVRAISEEHGIFCILTQLVGFEGGKGFVGGSMVTDPFGRVLGRAPIGKEAMLVVECDMEQVQIARAQSPLISDLQSVWPVLQGLVLETEFEQ